MRILSEFVFATKQRFQISEPRYCLIRMEAARLWWVEWSRFCGQLILSFVCDRAGQVWSEF